ncbi:MAG: urease accessory protein UreF [Rhodospirillales bacterium]
MTWLSPAFPVGGFSYSHGLELAVDAGLVGNAHDLAEWTAMLLTVGSGRVDAILLSHAWRAERDGDDAAAAETATLADACRGTAELALESRAQGEAFLAAVRDGWPDPALDAYAQLLARIGRPPAYACVVGVAAAIADIPEHVVRVAFLHAFAAAMVTAGVKLIPLGQRAGLAVLAGLEPAILTTARAAGESSLGDIASSTWMIDWASAAHESLYTRLFRS